MYKDVQGVRRESMGDSEQGAKVQARQEGQDGNATEKKVGTCGENWGLPVQEPSRVGRALDAGVRKDRGRELVAEHVHRC
jgi:hypothetical protein